MSITVTNTILPSEFVKVNAQIRESRIPLVMKEFDQYERRVTYAYGLMLLRLGRTKLSQEEFAQLVSKKAKKQVAQQNASGWLAGKIPREFDMQVALAQALGADPGWLYFGPRYSSAPEPGAPRPGADTASGAPSVYGSEAQKDAEGKRQRLGRVAERDRGVS